jgi:hypothetical protein
VTRYCPNCGAPRAASTKICAICGVDDAAPGAAVLASPGSGVSNPQNEHDRGEGPFSAAQITPALQRPKLGLSRGKMALMACLLLLVLSLLCIGLSAILADVAWATPRSGTVLGAQMAMLTMQLPCIRLSPGSLATRLPISPGVDNDVGHSSAQPGAHCL